MISKLTAPSTLFNYCKHLGFTDKTNSKRQLRYKPKSGETWKCVKLMLEYKIYVSLQGIALSIMASFDDAHIYLQSELVTISEDEAILRFFHQLPI